MATATKAKKATREFWISRSPGTYSVCVWIGKRAPQTCSYCDDPKYPENQPASDFKQVGGYIVATECVSDFRRVTGINVKEGEALLVRMTVVKRVK